jgi:hypothetical protein
MGSYEAKRSRPEFKNQKEPPKRFTRQVSCQIQSTYHFGGRAGVASAAICQPPPMAL